LKQWVRRLLSRPAVEELVFKAFQRPRKEYMEDIWDAGHLCKILLKKGEWFLPGPANETRLVFSFSVDSFNPFHMKEAKQTILSTAIWLVLLNLPPHLRYRCKASPSVGLETIHIWHSCYRIGPPTISDSDSHDVAPLYLSIDRSSHLAFTHTHTHSLSPPPITLSSVTYLFTLTLQWTPPIPLRPYTM